MRWCNHLSTQQFHSRFLSDCRSGELTVKILSMKLFLLLFSFSAFSQVNLLTDKKHLKKTRLDQKKLLSALAECKPFEMQHSHPALTKNPLISKVYGLQKDKSCLYTQSFPHGSLKTCRFSDKQLLTIKTQGQKGLNQFMTDTTVCKDSGNKQ